ncbi:glutamine--fructose-6-phosphate aminotransferase, partial [bacterium]|nr:glutamine--fructose-6-phosphate aminotransferase [bacterium]
MCGIIGYVGERPALPILIAGLKRMEYRGYDSAGVALYESHGLTVVKAEGKISTLEAVLRHGDYNATLGIAHTRWATHGPPTHDNAHPHTDESGGLALVHNGIIENFQFLRRYLKGQGIEPRTETDTEVLALLVAHYYEGSLEQG